ncbi:hypothetical protein NMY22_g399 [Coprinellus aureogranulatus]|nr:hypothetical protein NMY22_g399 [Coprinellus aureogranulatus]
MVSRWRSRFRATATITVKAADSMHPNTAECPGAQTLRIVPAGKACTTDASVLPGLCTVPPVSVLHRSETDMAHGHRIKPLSTSICFQLHLPSFLRYLSSPTPYFLENAKLASSSNLQVTGSPTYPQSFTMVGWIPPNELRLQRLHECLESVKASERAIQLHNKAHLLHYDARTADMVPYAWPLLGGAKVTPNLLDHHRHTHSFLAPSCPCALLDGKSYTESKIGLVQQVSQPPTAECLGQYAAICAEQRCGYFVPLEPFYSHPSLLVKAYPEREKPLLFMSPLYFTTGDTPETAKMAGLRQIQVLRDDSNTGLRGTRNLLRREDPVHFRKFDKDIERLLTEGLPGTKFWDIFIQCTQCNHVMPAHHFPYYHECTQAAIKGFEHTALMRSYRSKVMDQVNSTVEGSDSDSNSESDMAVEDLPSPHSSSDNLQEWSELFARTSSKST